MLTFLIITFLSVVFGELIPKTVGLQNSEGTALHVAKPLLWFTRLAHPLVLVMDGFGNWLLRRIGYDPDAEAEKPHSVEELTLLIEDSAEAGVLMPTQATFVANLLRLSEKRAADVMQPIDKVGALELSADPQAILQRVQEQTFTRMPVYQGSLDNILGIANTKQLLRHYLKTGIVKLEEVVYPAIVVKPDALLPDVIKVLRDARYPMGLVRDGDKVLGLLTLEDVLEEVVGEIVDEHDYPAPKVTGRMLQAIVQTLPKRKPGGSRSIQLGGGS
jgi:CBS domain containing-hemolysin-like protein